MQKHKKNNLFFMVGITLFTLFLFSSMVTSGILARYTGVSSNDDDARVAKFDVDVTLKDVNTSTQIITLKDYDFHPGSEAPIDIKFDGSDNEVAVRCKVEFEIITILPLRIMYNSYDKTTEGIEITINPKSSEQLEDVTITWDSLDNSFIYNGQKAVINIIITVEQID